MYQSKYEKGIIESIILTSPVKIEIVTDIEDLGMYAFNQENFNKICDVLESGQYSELPMVKKIIEKHFDDITVFRFKDGKGDIYYTMIYDSWMLEQDPEVMKIYPVVLPKPPSTSSG